MSDTIQRRGNWEYRTDADGNSWKRRIKDGSATEWQPLSPFLKPEVPIKYLWLVLHAQAEGEPNHWSLFIGPEGQPGSQYQVTGDATFQEHKFAQDVNIWTYTDYLTSYSLTELDDDDVVKQAAEAETPPRAKNRAEVKEHCQGWTVRVLKRLCEEGIVGEAAVNLAEELLEPI